MKLSLLEIRTLPGIEPGFTLEKIAPGGNLVTGPNAVGKSSLIRALGYLVGGVSNDDPKGLSLRAVFQGKSGRWTVRRLGSELNWESEDGGREAPPLPDRNQLHHCYWLSMENLLRADQQDDVLLLELRRELSGGYDMDTLRGEAVFRLRPRHGRSETRALADAERARREMEADYKALRHEMIGMPRLEEHIREARDAAGRAERLEQALELLELHRRRRELEAGLQEFPKGMERLRGDELKRMETLDGKRGQLRDRMEAQDQALAESRGRLRETGLDEGRPESTELQAHSRDLEQARRLGDQRNQKQGELEEAATAEKQALGSLGGECAAPRLDPDSVSQAERLAGRLQSHIRKSQELRDQVEQAGQAPCDQERIDEIYRAMEALRSWLTFANGNPGRLRAGLLLAGIGTLLSVIVALLVEVRVLLWGAGITLLGVLWACFEARVFDCASARRRFRHCAVKEPREWHPEQVRQRLQELERERQELLHGQLRFQQAEEVRWKLSQVEQELDGLLKEKTAMAGRLGFDPELTAVSLDRFVRLVGNYQRNQEKRATAQAAIERLDEEIETCAGRLRGFLGRWAAIPTGENSDKGPGGGLEALDIHLEELRRRCEAAGDAQNALRAAEREQGQSREAAAALDREEADFFKELGLEPGARQELERRLERFDAWREQRNKLHEAEVLEARQRQGLQDREDLLRLVEADERARLERDLEQDRRQSTELETQQEALTALRTRLREAGKDFKLEEAAAQADSAHAALEGKYHEALFADAANLLLDSVQREYHSEHEPEVLRDARDRFLRFTHQAFALEIDESKGCFVARDLQQQTRRSLSRLSSATRMQLLLAMRLARMRSLERGRETLPLFLDEALTTSDEQRFREVAKSLEQLAREEERQIFYLSARRQEVALWGQATGRPPHHIDLAAVRFGLSSTAPGDFALPPTESKSIPPPDGCSPESYAASLGVPPLNPYQPEGMIHLFHLLRDDLELLHRLMEDWRLTTLGQLKSLLDSSAAAIALPDSEYRRRLQGRCETARIWRKIWLRGRGKPVDRIALDRSRIVSDIFIGPAAALADTLEGNGAVLIKLLRKGRIPNFRKQKAEDLAEWLKQEGYIDEAEILKPEERERDTLHSAARCLPPGDIRRLVPWLEATIQKTGPELPR